MMKTIRLGLLTALMAILIPLAATAHEFKLGELTIGHPWANPSIGGSTNGAVFLTIINGGTAADRLIGVASPVAGRVELHTHLMEDGVMKMRKIEGIDVEPGAPIALKPGGLHVMLIGLKAQLKDGDSFPLDLTFAKAGTVTTTVMVQASAAMEGMEGMHHQH